MTKDAEFYFKRSEDKFHHGNSKGGLEDLDQAIALDPNNLDYRWSRGNLAYEGENYLIAVEDFTKIITLTSDKKELQEAFTKRAISYETLGRYTDLINDLNSIIDEGLGNSQTYVWRGSHKYKLGNIEEAIEDFTEAHILSPQDIDVLMQRANSLYQIERYEEAVHDLSQILESGESNPSYLAITYGKRGKALYQLGKLNEALDDFNQIQKIRGEKPFTNPNDYMKLHGTDF